MKEILPFVALPTLLGYFVYADHGVALGVSVGTIILLQISNAHVMKELRARIDCLQDWVLRIKDSGASAGHLSMVEEKVDSIQDKVYSLTDIENGLTRIHAEICEMKYSPDKFDQD